MILSAFAFSVMSLFVKAVGQTNIPVLEIVAARSVVSLLISYVTLKRQGIAPLGNRKLLLFARGLVGFLALNCVFYAITHLPLAQATVLQYLHPMFTAALAVFFLSERPTKGTLICIALSFVGLLLVVQPGFIFSLAPSGIKQFAISVAVAGAFGSAIAYILVRKLSTTEHPLVIVMYFPLISLPISVILLWNDFVMPQGITWLYLLAIGLTTQVGQVALTKAMQTETASRATSFAYLQVVFAMILGVVFYYEIPSFSTLIGAGLIVGGAYINATWKKGNNVKKPSS
ncbi:MAG: EamA family transporter [Moraxellaceae bacterium]|nr:MAG: EamA family transporter [Moraxellaceae bacterium]